jgi:hypothetical protein
MQLVGNKRLDVEHEVSVADYDFGVHGVGGAVRDDRVPTAPAHAVARINTFGLQ